MGGPQRHPKYRRGNPMPQEQLFSSQQVSVLKQWLADHSDYDWLQMNWQDETVLKPLLGEESATLLPLLKAYQRLLRIIPTGYENLALPLLASGLHSAVQIASLASQQFLELTRDLVPEQPEVMEAIYRYAQLKRSQLVVQYMNILQNQEPHVRAARI